MLLASPRHSCRRVQPKAALRTSPARGSSAAVPLEEAHTSEVADSLDSGGSLVAARRETLQDHGVNDKAAGARVDTVQRAEDRPCVAVVPSRGTRAEAPSWLQCQCC